MRSGPSPGSAARPISPIRGRRPTSCRIVRSNTMPQSPFAVPLRENRRPTVGIAGTRHAFNADEIVSGDPGQQGTQMDALGHFAVLPEAWDGKGEFPAGRATYYGGYTQSQVKPTPDSPLLKLGIDKVPPIITTAVLLDAKAHLGRGSALQPGQLVTAQDIDGDAQGAGAGESRAPRRVMCSTSTPAGAISGKIPTPRRSTTPRVRASPTTPPNTSSRKPSCWWRSTTRSPIPSPRAFLQGKAPPPAGTPPGLPFAIHHHNLTEARHLQHPERQPRRFGRRQGLAVLHHYPAAAHAGRVGIAGAAGRDRRAGTVTGQRVRVPMLSHARSLLAALLVLPLWTCNWRRRAQAGPAAVRPASWARPIALAGAPEMHWVADNFYRSAQPDAEGFRALATQYGIRTVISLRAFNADEELANGLGLRLERFRIHTWRIRSERIVGALRTLRLADARGAGLAALSAWRRPHRADHRALSHSFIRTGARRPRSTRCATAILGFTRSGETSRGTSATSTWSGYGGMLALLEVE